MAADIITKTFEFKLRTNKKFVAACEAELEHSRQIYNAALQERIECYKLTGKSLSFVEQSRHLTEARTLPDVKAHLRTIQSDALERLDEAFKAFFKRCAKRQGQAGFPRFRGKDRYHTLSQKYEVQRGCPLKGDKLIVPGIGSVRVRLSREIEGRVKQLRITRRADGWFVLLVCDLAKPEPLPKTGQSIGVDVGLTTFATLSNGEKIENPRHLKAAEKKLTKRQRQLSRKRKGSANRLRARQRVARTHLHVARCRKDFHHKTAKQLVTCFDRIAVEALNVRGMVKNHHLAKAISDVGWSRFFTITKAKAENAGREFVKVPAAYTSQTCSRCGHRQKMPLHVRQFVCEKCGLEICRDVNGSHNVLASSQKLTPVESDSTRGNRNKRVKKTKSVSTDAGGDFLS